MRRDAGDRASARGGTAAVSGASWGNTARFGRHDEVYTLSPVRNIMREILAMTALSLGALQGCNTGIPDVGTEAGSASEAGSTTALNHETTVGVYRFPLSGEVKETSDSIVRRSVGQSETIIQYARPYTVRSVVAWSNASAPQMLSGWPADKSAHEQMARSYFASIGIPSNELGAAYNLVGKSSGAAVATPAEVTEVELGYTTTFVRVVDGVPIPDSHAGVQLNAANTPVALSISWPDVPTDVLAAAQQMKVTVGPLWRLPANIQRRLTHVKSEVVIRHTAPDQLPERWRAVVRTSLTTSGQRRTHVDTDLSGAVVVEFDAPRPSESVK